MKFPPHIIFFVHDDGIISTLKRMYLAFCFPIDQETDRVVILSNPTYDLINMHFCILPITKDFFVDIGSYTGKICSKRLQVLHKRKFMFFKTSNITDDTDKFKKSIKNVIKKYIHDEYDEILGIENPANDIFGTITRLLRYARGFISEFDPQTNLFEIKSCTNEGQTCKLDNLFFLYCYLSLSY